MRRLHNQVRHYHWGSTTAIPRLLGRAPDGRPHAELWLGAHGAAPSHVDTPAGPVALDAAIHAAPEEYLGREVMARFGARLPFLLKVLAARKPLSLQVHPDSRQAEAGFAAEEAAGIPRDAPARTFPDPFHKPELLIALGSFEALCGFRAPAHAEEDLEQLSGQLARDIRRELGSHNGAEAMHEAVSRLLALRTADPRRLLDGFFGECAERAARGGVPDSLRTALDLACRFPGDPGAAIAPLLHRTQLAAGDALLIPPGCVHAHLGGIALEIMAGSDNVLRAGLTNKHVDTAGVLDVADFTIQPVPRLAPRRAPGGIVHYPTEYPEFCLHMMSGGEETTVPAGQLALALVLTGTCVMRGRGKDVKLNHGESAFVAATDTPVDLRVDGYTVVASVGEESAV